jgi:hypothetical protein
MSSLRKGGTRTKKTVLRHKVAIPLVRVTVTPGNPGTEIFYNVRTKNKDDAARLVWARHRINANFEQFYAIIVTFQGGKYLYRAVIENVNDPITSEIEYCAYLQLAPQTKINDNDLVELIFHHISHDDE